MTPLEAEKERNWQRFLGFLALPFMLLLFLVGAFVTQQIWAWYIVPLLHWPALRLIEAFGVNLFIGRFFGSSSLKNEYKKDSLEILIEGLLGAGLTLLCGWLGHFWM